MNKKVRGIGLGLSALIIAVTVVVYMLLARDIFHFPMCWIAMSAIVLSELCLVASSLLAKDLPSRIGVACVFAVQTVLTVLVSLLYINLFIFSYVSFFIYYILSFTVALVVAVIIVAHSGIRIQNEAALQQAKSKVGRCRIVVSSMISSPNGKVYLNELKRLDENLRFSDDSIVLDIDDQIYQKICELSGAMATSGFDVPVAVDDINNLIKHRNFLARNAKNNI